MTLTDETGRRLPWEIHRVSFSLGTLRVEGVNHYDEGRAIAWSFSWPDAWRSGYFHRIRYDLSGAAYAPGAAMRLRDLMLGSSEHHGPVPCDLGPTAADVANAEAA